MRRPACLLSLAVVLLCPALCQADAAESLARSLAERLDLVNVEPADPACCDAQSLGALKAQPHPGPAADQPPPAPDGLAPIPAALSPTFDAPSHRDAHDRPPPPTSRRLALLRLLLC